MPLDFKYRIAIVGSRDGVSREAVREFVDKLDPDTNVVVSGGARGVDSWAVERAEERSIPVDVYRAEWKKYGKSAGFKRNRDIVRNCDAVAAFWDGESKGTQHTIKVAVEAGRSVAVFGPTGSLIRWITPNIDG